MTPAEWYVIQGDCLDVLKEVPDSYFDAICSDPPAGIDFMHRDWDCFRRRHNPNDVGRPNVFGRTSATAPHSYGESDRGNFIAFMTAVMREVHRTLKPGSFGLIWALPRTSHWTAMALEDAGFEIRDVLTHHFGSGFPKSQNVATFIDKALGAKGDYGAPKSEAHAGWIDRGRMRGEEGHEGYQRPWMDDPEQVEKAARVYEPASVEARRWIGWGTALKPGTEHWILVRKPLDRKLKTVAKNVVAHGTGALNIDACRVERASADVPGWHKTGSYGRESGYRPQTCPFCDGSGVAVRFSDGAPMPRRAEDAAVEPCFHCAGEGVVASSTFQIRDMPPEEVQARCGSRGRWPTNLLLTHSAGCRCVGTERAAANGNVSGQEPSAKTGAVYGEFGEREGWAAHGNGDGTETVEVWECMDDCPVAELNAQSGVRKSGKAPAGGLKRRQSHHDTEAGWGMRHSEAAGRLYGDSGGASRYFPTFHYYPKPARKEREAGCEALADRTLNRVNPGGLENEPRFAPIEVKNNHPTVKGKELMKWLCQLICPEGGQLLDPFAGSGSTGVACMELGINFTGIEQDENYIAIAEARIGHAAGQSDEADHVLD